MKLGGGKDSYRLKYTCAADLRSFQCLSLEKLANSMVCTPPTVFALLPGRILTSCCDNISQPRRMSSSVLLGHSTWWGGTRALDGMGWGHPGLSICFSLGGVAHTQCCQQLSTFRLSMHVPELCPVHSKTRSIGPDEVAGDGSNLCACACRDYHLRHQLSLASP